MNPPLPATAQHSSSCGLRSSTSSSDGPPSFVLYDPPGLLCSEAPSFRENVWRNDDPMMWGVGGHLSSGARSSDGTASPSGGVSGKRARRANSELRGGGTERSHNELRPQNPTENERATIILRLPRAVPATRYALPSALLLRSRSLTPGYCRKSHLSRSYRSSYFSYCSRPKPSVLARK